MSSPAINDDRKWGPMDPIYRSISEQIYKYLIAHLTLNKPADHPDLHCLITVNSTRQFQCGSVFICDGPHNPHQRVYQLVLVHYDGTVCHFAATGYMPSSHKTYKPVNGALTEVQLAEILQYVSGELRNQTPFGPLCGMDFNCTN